jgi:hypothetical protein
MPALDAWGHLLPRREGGEPGPSRSAGWGAATRGGEEPRRLAWGLDARHAPLALAGGRRGVLGAVLAIAVRARFHPRSEGPRRGPSALPHVRDAHPRPLGPAGEPRPDACLRGLLGPVAWPEPVQPVALWIDRPPPVMPLARAPTAPLLPRPRIAGLGAAGPCLMGRGLAACPAPRPERRVGDEDAPGEAQRFAITVAEAQTAVEPDAGTEALGRHSMGWGRVGEPGGVHGRSSA